MQSLEHKYDLVVAYRIYPAVSKTPLVHQNDKYQLARLCLTSFKKSLGALKVKMLVLLDNCPAEYKNMFTDLFAEPDLVFHEYNGIGNQATFNRQIELLLEQNYADTIYFAEDDYFYLENQFPEMLEFLQSQTNVDFITPYDHPDYYTRPFHRPPAEIRILGKRRWRTAQSTCLTFLTTKSTLQRTEKLFRSFALGNHDHALWAAITKFSGMKGYDHIRAVLRENYYLKLLFLTWRYGYTQILFGKKWQIWAPLPAIATHIEKAEIAPGINWGKKIKEINNL